MKTALVLGGGGFIGGHLAKRLKEEGLWVRVVDIKDKHEFWEQNEICQEYVSGDLRDPKFVKSVFDREFDEVYQLAADMGGAGFVFTGENDADIMHNSALINLNVLETCKRRNILNIFYSSSACMYPQHNQMDPENPMCSEDSAYPADPDSEYGWEKLFSERLYLTYARNYNLNCKVARYHNIFGPKGTWNGGREKAPAALCRKIAYANDGAAIDIWGDGLQTRSFLYIDECVEATTRLLRSNWSGPVNIGSEEMVTINQLADMIMKIANKKVTINHIPGPLGVRGRNSDNRLIKEKLGWKPSLPLNDGLKKTYEWIFQQVKKNS
jgi:nucleoside-diphosphate-sugar epimerase